MAIQRTGRKQGPLNIQYTDLPLWSADNGNADTRPQCSFRAWLLREHYRRIEGASGDVVGGLHFTNGYGEAAEAVAGALYSAPCLAWAYDVRVEEGQRIQIGRWPLCQLSIEL